MRKLFMILALAFAVLFTPIKAAHAAPSPIDYQTLQDLRELIAISVTDSAQHDKVRNIITKMRDQLADMRTLQKGTKYGTSAYMAYRWGIYNLAATIEAMEAGLYQAQTAGYQYAGAIGTRILVGVPIFFGPTDALLQQMMMGEGYQPQYDSAMYDPTGYYGEFHVGGSLWLERVLDMEGSKWGSAWGSSGSSSTEEVAWSQWSIFDPAEDDPGAVPSNYGAATEALYSGTGITAQSEGPLGPLMLSAGYTDEMLLTNYMLSHISYAADRPVTYLTVVDGTNIATVVYPDAYIESHTADGSVVRWHMDFPF
jgi:hypothetical protein